MTVNAPLSQSGARLRFVSFVVSATGGLREKSVEQLGLLGQSRPHLSNVIAFQGALETFIGGGHTDNEFARRHRLPHAATSRESPDKIPYAHFFAIGGINRRARSSDSGWYDWPDLKDKMNCRNSYSDNGVIGKKAIHFSTPNGFSEGKHTPRSQAEKSRIACEMRNRKCVKCYAPRKCLDLSGIGSGGGRSKPSLRDKAFIPRILLLETMRKYALS